MTRRPRGTEPCKITDEAEVHGVAHLDDQLLRRQEHRIPLTLFWTVLVGKELHRGDLSPPGDDYRWVSVSASYLFDQEAVRRTGVMATRCRPGPATEEQPFWFIRDAE